jgi:hypothetical protein
MSSSIRAHIQNNVIGYIALFFVFTGGTAYALNGSNTVFSDDITDGEVKAPDLAAGSVNSGKITDGNVTNADLGADSVATGNVIDGNLTGADLKDHSIGGQKVGTETLSGANVNDGSLFGADIANFSLTQQDIGSHAVGTSQLDPAAFLPGDIGQVSATDQRYGIPNDAIQGAEVQDDSLTDADIKESTLDTPEAAYYLNAGSVSLPTNGASVTAARRVVEPGSYVILGKLIAFGGGDATAHCQLNVNGGPVDEDHAYGLGGDTRTMTLVGVAGTAQSNIDLAVVCQSATGVDFSSSVSTRKLVAIKVNRLIGANAG